MHGPTLFLLASVFLSVYAAPTPADTVKDASSAPIKRVPIIEAIPDQLLPEVNEQQKRDAHPQIENDGAREIVTRGRYQKPGGSGRKRESRNNDELAARGTYQRPGGSRRDESQIGDDLTARGQYQRSGETRRSEDLRNDDKLDARGTYQRPGGSRPRGESHNGKITTRARYQRPGGSV